MENERAFVEDREIESYLAQAAEGGSPDPRPRCTLREVHEVHDHAFDGAEFYRARKAAGLSRREVAKVLVEEFREGWKHLVPALGNVAYVADLVMLWERNTTPDGEECMEIPADVAIGMARALGRPLGDFVYCMDSVLALRGAAGAPAPVTAA
jgi:hypothetical protein